ncbi:NAD(P)/FAD-dependent oxidoreductase [Flavisolibacter ginsenosidimutans]|uniref:FAD-binding oxidoreductase n=1 Tax=Flavisolibacter ginsenosidimutans TaxID=661481 RepID=A0A5B8UEU2_9BACT|nr:FAD-dependent oxidoreductase [Flavisolibacter ginsenosidimutans]QEC54649.1 FAD-binding oxidoreductase [Flavisolibacter ginsenosidimutans]
MAMQISIWEKETFFAHQDVVIIGSGFVGLWSAFYLKKKNPKLKITVVEKGVIPSGASTRNAGFATFGSLSELVWDAQTMGTDKMLEVTEMRFKGLQRIQKYFGKKEIDFEPCGGYELYEENIVSTEKLKENIAYANTLLKPITSAKKTYRLADEKISELGFGKTKHLVETKLEGYLHSGKLLQALLQKVQGMGVAVMTGIEITNINSTDKKIELTTNQPFNFSTDQLLVCTNAFTKTLLPELDIVPARGQILLTSPIKNLPFKGTFHSNEGFYYFRNLDNRVLLGGARNKAFADEATTDLGTTDFIQHELEKYLAEVILPHFQNQYAIEQRWSGIMAFGAEKTPIVKQVSDNVFCAVRMSGVGVALSPVVAQQVAGMMRD